MSEGAQNNNRQQQRVSCKEEAPVPGILRSGLPPGEAGAERSDLLRQAPPLQQVLASATGSVPPKTQVMRPDALQSMPLSSIPIVPETGEKSTGPSLSEIPAAYSIGGVQDREHVPPEPGLHTVEEEKRKLDEEEEEKRKKRLAQAGETSATPQTTL